MRSEVVARSVTPVIKPLRPLDFFNPTLQNSAKSLSVTNKNKQKSVVVKADRLHAPSARDRRFTLTTLDVLKQFVAAHNPRATKTEYINESVVLNEFRAHLSYHLDHLMDLHASIRDITNDIVQVQKQKNEKRAQILELRKQHAQVGLELEKVRKTYTDAKREREELGRMASSFKELRDHVNETCTSEPSLNDKVWMKITDLGRVFGYNHGLREQLQRVNTRLSTFINRDI